MSDPVAVARRTWCSVRHVVRVTRQHHALEHATLQILAEQVTTQELMGGYSDPGGFVLLGKLTSHQVEQAVHQALAALREGRSQLAIHPACGTNHLTQAVLSLILACTTLNFRRGFSLSALGVALGGFMAISLFSRALGNRLQVYTTLADVHDRQVSAIYGIEVLRCRGVRVCVTDAP